MEEYWLNPESPKYYKGYRFEKKFDVNNGNLLNLWYDSNNVIRKEIAYYDNNSERIKHEIYYNENGLLHNEEGYAYQSWESYGMSKRKEYGINGETVSEYFWKILTGKFGKIDDTDINSRFYYKGYRYELKNRFERWFDENNTVRKCISHHKNGKVNEIEYFNEYGEYHNEEGFAYQSFDSYTGEKRDEKYFLNDYEFSKEDWEKELVNPKIENLEYLKPYNVKYYKGFTYRKDGKGNEHWYDEKKNIRKRIFYREKNIKWYESYFNENSEYHNEEGYAHQEWDENGYVIKQQYWLNDKKISESEWLIKTGKPDYLIPNSPKYYKGYRYEKDKHGDELWFDENGTIRKRIDYFGNGNKFLEEYFNEKGDSHNEDGYAVQEWCENGKIFSQVYCLNNEEISENLFNYFKSFTDFSKVTRLEVIDENGRSYIKKKKDCKIDLSLQDDGKTLKVFFI